MLGLLSTASLSKAGLKGVNVSRWLSTSPYALSKIIYTETDEAPMLATFSLLPVIQRFAEPMGIEVSPGICISQRINSLRSEMYSWEICMLSLSG